MTDIPDPFAPDTGETRQANITRRTTIGAFAAAALAPVASQARASMRATDFAVPPVSSTGYFRPTLEQAIADFPVGTYFISTDSRSHTADPKQLRHYLRTAEAPYFVDQGDSAAPVTLAQIVHEGGSALVGYLPVGGSAAQLTVQDKLRGGAVSPAEFGAIGDGVADDTAALTNMFASGARRFDLGHDRTYKINLIQGTHLAKFVGGEADVMGDNVLILDVSTGYTNNGPFTQVFWGEGTTRLHVEGVNYRGPLLPDLHKLLGYQGATFVRVTNNARNTHITANVENARHGIHSGDYRLWELGYCHGFSGRITGRRIGYPLALYLASNVAVDVDCDQFHRLAYLAGCQHISGIYCGKDQYIAPIFSLITDAKTSDTTSRGCLDYKARVYDKGSSVYLPAARLVAIVPSWSFDGTEYEDIELHAHIASTDTVASKLGHAAVYAVSGIDWRPTQKIKNLKICGELDRSAQTTTEQDSSGEIYLVGISGPYADGKFVNVEGLDISGFVYKPGSGLKPRGFLIQLPGLTGGAKVENIDFADSPLRWGTNATSLTKFTNSRFRGTYEGGDDSPYESLCVLDNCIVTTQANQPTTNKRFINTLVQGGGTTFERMMTELPLNGISVTWQRALPDQSIILGVSGYITQSVTGPAEILVGTAAEPARFYNRATLALGSCFGPAHSTDIAPRYQLGTADIVITAKSGEFSGGALRLAVDFIRMSPPNA